MTSATRTYATSPQESCGENQVVWTIWMAYGAFYFGRMNLAVALPGIEEEFGYDKVQMSIVLLATKFTYGIGQFINGQLAEQISPRKMIAVGMLASAGLNVLFGFGTALYFFLFVWAMNGYCQSLGWPPCVRVLGNWVPVARRGKAMGIVGTGYQLTAGLTFLVAGFSVSVFGWRGALWVPPLILVLAALATLIVLKDSPDDSLQRSGHSKARGNIHPKGSFLQNLKVTLTNPALWLLALSLGLLNACRYGFIDWGVTHLYSIEKSRLEQGMTDVSAAALDAAVLSAAVQYAVLPLGGILGSYWAGWASDRYFGSRRAPVTCGLLLLLGVLTLVYEPVAQASFAGTIVLLIAIGFAVFGPQVIMVGTAPADLAKNGTAAAAAGFVNCMGYFGAAICGDLLTGHLAEHYGWNVAIMAWAAWAFLAAGLVALLWNTTGNASKST